jgi:myo-inositol-1(or 4)-monophosphatase
VRGTVPAVDEAELLEVAEAAARAAAPPLLESFGREIRTATKSTATDPVSEADLAAERAIRAVLSERRPGDAVLGEEGGETSGSSGVRWVIDPLDGTVNYLFGIPQWAVSVAAEDEGGGLAGVVLDPVRDEVWVATRSGPAFGPDGAPVSPSEKDDLRHALVATGFGYDAEVREAQATIAARILPRVRDLRRLGSAALDLVWTAAGRYDAYFERGVKPWDVAAGALVCARAGLSVRSLAPAPPQEGGILVAPAVLADALEPLVR